MNQFHHELFINSFDGGEKKGKETNSYFSIDVRSYHFC